MREKWVHYKILHKFGDKFGFGKMIFYQKVIEQQNQQ